MNNSQKMILDLSTGLTTIVSTDLRREATKLPKILPAALFPTVRQQGLTVRGVHYTIVLKSSFPQEPDCYRDKGLQN